MNESAMKQVLPGVRLVRKDELQSVLASAEDDSLDLIVVATGAFGADESEEVKSLLGECARTLRDGGLLFVQGVPERLPEYGVFLDRRLSFKYWIAVESSPMLERPGLPSVHAGVLLFTKGNRRLNVRRTRFPHQYCSFCGKSLKDWGGKSHLMNPDGCVISDVWTELPPSDNYTGISTAALNTIVNMLDFPSRRRISGLIGPSQHIGTEPIHASFHVPMAVPKNVSAGSTTGTPFPEDLLDSVICGDAVETLKCLPDASVNLVFADPPYNLGKAYSIYQDGSEEEQYLRWCEEWLTEYVRVLKPTGSLYVLNLPRWTMYHADFLNRHLYFQNWIVWDALSEPRGKLMPAHYGLLFYTKRPSGFTFNYRELSQIDARHYCLRASCVSKRKTAGSDEKEPLTDIWWDIHRIKHKRDRDHHPCQLPDALMERIIRLSSNPGDVVLDALSGTGTTAVTAARLGRRHIAIDLDPDYVRITQDKLRRVQENGVVERESVRRARPQHSKKELQLALRDLAKNLGRLPTLEDAARLTPYSPDVFLSVFPTWGKALKAAKIEPTDVSTEEE